MGLEKRPGRLVPDRAASAAASGETAHLGLRGHHRLDAVRAHLLERAGDPQAAIAHYRTAAGRTINILERNYLMTQAARLADQ